MQVSAVWIWAVVATAWALPAHSMDAGCLAELTLIADGRFIARQPMSFAVVADHELCDFARVRGVLVLTV